MTVLQVGNVRFGYAGDTLFDTALYRLAAAAVAQPALAILYGDGNWEGVSATLFSVS